MTNVRIRFGLAAGLTMLLTAGAQAQAPLTDVILRLDGQEISGRVVVITPTELLYLPAPPPTTRPDTLRLPVSQVFLVRYANGTKDILTRPVAPEPVLGSGRLQYLVGPERRLLGQADAEQYYQGKRVFWGAAGVSWLGLPGLVGVAVAANKPVPLTRLNLPEPVLLQDTNYLAGYQEQANRIKRRKVWQGYGTGIGLLVGLVVAGLANER